MSEKELLKEYYHILKLKPDKSRMADQVKARAAMMMAMRDNGLKLAHIAQVFDIDHTTVVHHTKKHESNLKFWDDYKRRYLIAQGLCGYSIKKKAMKWKIKNLSATISRLSKMKQELEEQLNQNSYE